MPIAKLFNKNFFKEWSPHMAYIVGFLYADGNIVQSKRGIHYVSLEITDRDIIYEIREIIGSNHTISTRQRKMGSVTYRLQIGSKELLCDMRSLGLHPNKTKRIMLPQVPRHLFGDFLRGYFDGDGNVWVGLVHKRKSVSTLVIRCAFTSGSVRFLKDIADTLHSMDIVGGSLYRPKSRGFGRLSFNTINALKIYNIMYNSPHKLHLSRKKAVFDRFLRKMRA